MKCGKEHTHTHARAYTTSPTIAEHGVLPAFNSGTTRETSDGPDGYIKIKEVFLVLEKVLMAASFLTVMSGRLSPRRAACCTATGELSLRNRLPVVQRWETVGVTRCFVDENFYASSF